MSHQNASPAPVSREGRIQAVFNSTAGSQGEQPAFPRGAISVVNNAAIIDRDITPNEPFSSRRRDRDVSPIIVQHNAQSQIQPSERSTSKEKSSVDPNWNRAALMKLKESIDHKSVGSASGSNSALAFN